MWLRCDLVIAVHAVASAQQQSQQEKQQQLDALPLSFARSFIASSYAGKKYSSE
jgi:hypothetical protein